MLVYRVGPVDQNQGERRVRVRARARVCVCVCVCVYFVAVREKRESTRGAVMMGGKGSRATQRTPHIARGVVSLFRAHTRKPRSCAILRFARGSIDPSFALPAQKLVKTE